MTDHGSSASKPFPRQVPPSATGTASGGTVGRPVQAAVRPVATGATWRPDRPAGEGETKKLIVGREICLSGEITSCDRLVVEGKVEATLTESRAIEIAEPGYFKGSAEIESAEIAGRFEGTLNVRDRLFIRSTGRVSGQVRYGQIEIEPGGEISGDIQVVGSRSQLTLKAVGDIATGSEGTSERVIAVGETHAT
ncbi:MAG: polymer-forming cytoskeletal protein [Proteobacteria bacterium]|nr:polymer-forming cytoskeletal protein [Pseudomonadota bacterium]